MKKIISLFLSIMLTIPLAGTAVAYWNDDWVPPGDWLGYTGEIVVEFTHKYSVTLRDYTADDFPLIKDEIESVENHRITSVLNPNMTLEEMSADASFKRSVSIFIKNTDTESVRSAVYYLDSLTYVSEAIACSALVKAGDANCDRIINLSDASYMLKHIAGWDDAPIEYIRTADMDLDEHVTLNDATILLQVIAGWEKWTYSGFISGAY